MKNNILILLVFLILGVTSCTNYKEYEIEQFDKAIVAFLGDSLDTYEKSESGLYFRVIEEGEGDYITSLDAVETFYKGRLINDTIFDQTKDTAISFELQNTIEGWREGFQYFKKNGKGQLIVPPNLGYGKQELKGIPANSILIFDFEIIGVE
jgi:FKBP-type peptidyl-prolyl cis-trans isomerase